MTFFPVLIAGRVCAAIPGSTAPNAQLAGLKAGMMTNESHAVSMASDFCKCNQKRAD